MNKKLLIASLALASSTSMAANIAFDDGKNITINGFANIVVGQTLNKDDVFLAEPIAGGVYENDLAFDKESVFGLKSTINFSSELSFTAQMNARSANDFNVEIDRAYVDYQINQNWKVSAGKKNLVFFQYSDYLDVGYAYNFMRPPTAVYIIPFGAYDGASVYYNSYIGDYDFSVEAYYGNTDGVDVVSFSGAKAKLTFDFQDIFGVVFNLASEDWSVRLGTHLFDMQSNVVGDINTENMIAGGFITQADADALGLGPMDLVYADGDPLIEPNNHGAWIVGGGSYTPGNLSINYEFFFYSDDLGFNEQESHFVNVSYQMGKWTPTVSWSNAKETQDSKVTSVVGINKGAPATDYGTLGLTLRYDLQSNIAAKFDITRFSDNGDSPTFGDSTVVSAGIYLTF